MGEGEEEEQEEGAYTPLLSRALGDDSAASADLHRSEEREGKRTRDIDRQGQKVMVLQR